MRSWFEAVFATLHSPFLPLSPPFPQKSYDYIRPQNKSKDHDISMINDFCLTQCPSSLAWDEWFKLDLTYVIRTLPNSSHGWMITKHVPTWEYVVIFPCVLVLLALLCITLVALFLQLKCVLFFFFFFFAQFHCKNNLSIWRKMKMLWNVSYKHAICYRKSPKMQTPMKKKQHMYTQSTITKHLDLYLLY